MEKESTRVSLSFPREIYNKLKAFSDKNKRTMVSQVEHWCDEEKKWDEEKTREATQHE